MNYSFKPKLYTTLITILLLVLMINLGFWQLHRAEYKRNLQSQYNQRGNASPLQLSQLTNFKEQDYFPLEVKGHYDHQHSILLQNKIYQHRVGYQVITPFFPEKGGPAILINRGWIPIHQDPKKLPTFDTETQSLSLKGIITTPSKYFMLGNNIRFDDNPWPLLMQQIEISRISELLKYPLLPIVVLLSPTEPSGFVREWSPVKSNPNMHLGYAFQWFALSLTLVICFIVVSTRRVK